MGMIHEGIDLLLDWLIKKRRRGSGGWGGKAPQLSSRIWSRREFYRIIHVFVAFSCELSGGVIVMTP